MVNGDHIGDNIVTKYGENSSVSKYKSHFFYQSDGLNDSQIGCVDSVSGASDAPTTSDDLSPGVSPSLEVLLLPAAAARQRREPSAPYIIKGKIKFLDGTSIVGHKK